MLNKRLIPSLLLRGGRLVKGVRFADYRDAGSPQTTARVHNAQGADELLLLDIDASRNGRSPDLETIAAVARECFMPLAVGGGINCLEVAQACMAAGADKICLTTTALDRPELIAELANVFGRQAIILGLDIWSDERHRWLFDHRIHRTLEDPDWRAWLRRAVSMGAGEVRLMAVDREGTRTGVDLDLEREAMDLVDVPVIVEGGADSLVHLSAALAAGADAIAVGTMLVFSDNNLMKVKRYLAADGHRMRI